MKKIVILLLMGLCLRQAEAQTPQTVTVTWGKISTYTDGTAIPAASPITYQLYVGASGSEVAYKTPVTSPPYVLNPTPAPGTSFCVQVTATVGGVESVKSAEVCNTVKIVLVPIVPPAVKVTVQ